MTNDKVTRYIGAHSAWQDQLSELRRLLQATTLEEEIKWGAPCYTLDGRNVVGLAAFKHHVALWFHQGALLSDDADVLVNAQEGKTRALRQWRFQAGDRIPVRKVQAYLRQAIALESSGQRVQPKKDRKLILPAELDDAFREDRKLAAAFKKLRPGLQREFADHISEAKREQTRLNRLEKIRPMVLEGVGLNDRYRQRG